MEDEPFHAQRVLRVVSAENEKLDRNLNGVQDAFNRGRPCAPATPLSPAGG